ncbi:hypothetical protein [Pseudarthrobacter sp. N5]
MLPGLHEELWPDYTPAVRTDILQKYNIAIPKTWDEFRDLSCREDFGQRN